MRWRSAPLGQIAASIEYGLTASATDRPAGPKFLRITDIQDDRVDWSSVPFCEATEREEIANRLAPGDIVFARTGATTGKSFLVRACPERSVFASYLIRVRPSEHVDSCYLSRFFQSSDYWRQISKCARGAAQLGVNSTILRELMVPLPPLDEQRRIAAILDQVDDLRHKRRLTLKWLDALAESLFVHHFSDVVENCRGWCRRPLSTIVQKFEGGKNIVAEGGESKSPFRVLKISAIQDLGFDERESKPLPNEYIPPDRHFVKLGDLLLSRANTAERVGMVALVDRNVSNLILPDKVLRFVWTCPPVLKYWLYCFRSRPVRALLAALSTGTSGSMKNISQQKLLSIKLGIPPREAQESFAEKVDGIDELKARQRCHLAKLDALFASLQHRAFSGEL